MPISKEGWGIDEQKEQDMFQRGWDIQVHEQGEGHMNGTGQTKYGYRRKGFQPSPVGKRRTNGHTSGRIVHGQRLPSRTWMQPWQIRGKPTS